MKRPRRTTIMKLAVSLLLGAAVNVAVAWGYRRFGGTPCRHSFMEVTSGAEGVQYARFEVGARDRCEVWRSSFDSLQTAGPGRPMVLWKMPGLCIELSKFDLPDRPMLGLVRLGLPCLSLQGAELIDTVHGPLGSSWMLRESSRAYYPYLPLWPGFAINTIFYAGVCWLLFAAPFALRRRRRIQRGLCPACAYPVGTNELCTECGKPVTAKAESTRQKAQIG